MAQDVAPTLSSKIEKDFEKSMENDRTVQRILKRIRDGTATQADVSEYAARVGKHSSAAMVGVLTPENLPDGKLYWNIADRTIRPRLEGDHKLVLSAARSTQKTINKSYGLNIDPPTTKINGRKVYNLLNTVTMDGANIESVLTEPVITLARTAYDGFQETNVQQMQQLGVAVIVNRTYDGVGLHDGKEACQWCIDRAGTFEGYSEAYDVGAFERHDGCGCTVEVIYKDGTVMDPWTKAEYDERTAEARAAAIEARQQELLDAAKNHKGDIASREVFIRKQMNQGMTAKSAYENYWKQVKK